MVVLRGACLSVFCGFGRTDCCGWCSAMGGSGLGSSTTYWGIQYVPSGERLGFQGSRLEGWISDRDGWRWEESGGDNRCYIQELDERWYYYEMEF